MKKYKNILIFVFTFGVVIFSCLFLIASGKSSPCINGFAVDSYGRLYVGELTKISVYKDKSKIKEISPLTTRGYTFTIKADEIIVATSSEVWYLNLTGEIKRSEDDSDTEKFNFIKSNNKTFISDTGKKYSIDYSYGRWKIVCDGSIILQMSLLDYIVKILLIISIVALVIFVPYYVVPGWVKRMKS